MLSAIRRASPRWLRRHWLRARARRRAVPSNRAVIFLVPGKDKVNGGILSISSLAEESLTLRAVHGGEVVVCPAPGDRPLLGFTQFDNPHELVDLAAFVQALRPGAEVLIHVPEIHVNRAGHFEALRLRERGIDARFNILLQNVDLLPRRDDVRRLQALGPVTATTAHKAYSDEATAQAIGCPIHHLSVWLCPERFERTDAPLKERLIMVSPDRHELRHAVLERLSRQLPDYRFEVVRKLTYRRYRALASRARFALTFGEGLDGYFIETIFSGGVGVAVYNDRFFTPKFRGLPCVYDSWDELRERFADDVRRLDAPGAYAAAQSRQFDVTASEYRRDEYLANLRAFYEANFAAPR